MKGLTIALFAVLAVSVSTELTPDQHVTMKDLCADLKDLPVLGNYTLPLTSNAVVLNQPELFAIFFCFLLQPTAYLPSVKQFSVSTTILSYEWLVFRRAHTDGEGYALPAHAKSV